MDTGMRAYGPPYCLKNRGGKTEDRNDFLGFFFKFGGKFSFTHGV
ncbi:hypothetical protein M114_0234 [Bacteroides fragilis str. 3986 N(B)22]|nr:hypothetical protein M111_0175 [Bacteroides fragilis str. 3986T(B)10]EYA54580.1 hypothetical protein M114_0234 [Bacteroides fragilis str. 3986 N(B)22]EYA77797.1 hypothetical protein M133_0150 [Bacteroides fragilis str. S24L26]EYA82132.1 hypothetical protein M134_0245 [Bacteroides fragilis str. S24L34]